MKYKKLPDSELEIMLAIWQSNKPVNSAYIQEILKGKKNWTLPTVLGFLTRLENKGFVSIEREGRYNVYTALIDKNEYLEGESINLFEKLCGKSLNTFILSLYNSKAIHDEDLIELKKFIDKTAKEE